MKMSHLVLLAWLGTSVVLPASAQPGPGPGPGTGPGPGRGAAAERPRFQFDQHNTFGWRLMTPRERAAHRDRMLAAKTYDECKAVRDEQHRLMQARAREQHITLAAPRRDPCERMKPRGLLK